MTVTAGAAATIATAQGAQTSAAAAVGAGALIVEPKVHVRSETSVTGATIGVTPGTSTTSAATSPTAAMPIPTAAGATTPATASLTGTTPTVAAAGARTASTAAPDGSTLPGWLLQHPTASTQFDVTEVGVSPTAIDVTTAPVGDVVRDGLLDIGESRISESDGFAGVTTVTSLSGDTAATVDPGTIATPVVGQIEAFLAAIDASRAGFDLTTAELTLTRSTPSASDITVDPATDWELTRQDGSGGLGLATEQVAPLEREDDTVTLTTRLSAEQAGAVHDLFPLVAGAVRRDPPDGDSYWHDTTGGTLSVSVSSPAAADLSGDWIVLEWELETSERQRRPWDATLTLGRDTT